MAPPKVQEVTKANVGKAYQKARSEYYKFARSVEPFPESLKLWLKQIQSVMQEMSSEKPKCKEKLKQIENFLKTIQQRGDSLVAPKNRGSKKVVKDDKSDETSSDDDENFRPDDNEGLLGSDNESPSSTEQFACQFCCF